jgi:hypothetical protein
MGVVVDLLIPLVDLLPVRQRSCLGVGFAVNRYRRSPMGKPIGLRPDGRKLVQKQIESCQCPGLFHADHLAVVCFVRDFMSTHIGNSEHEDIDRTAY